MMKYIFIYIISVVIINIMFAIIPLIPLPFNSGMWSIGSVFAGFVFIFRDYAQRDSGKLVFPAMIVAIIISYFMASPFVALASATAFALSEFIDYAVYSITKKPFKQRVILSSLISTPIDSAVFLLMISHFGWVSFAVMTLSKLLSLIWVVRYTR